MYSCNSRSITMNQKIWDWFIANISSSHHLNSCYFRELGQMEWWLWFLMFKWMHLFYINSPGPRFKCYAKPVTVPLWSGLLDVTAYWLTVTLYTEKKSLTHTHPHVCQRTIHLHVLLKALGRLCGEGGWTQSITGGSWSTWEQKGQVFLLWSENDEVSPAWALVCMHSARSSGPKHTLSRSELLCPWARPP